jgi:hypothetical protein
MTDPQWIPQDDEPKDYDEVNAERQAGNVYSVRYALPEPVDGIHALVTVGFYCEDEWELCGQPSDGTDTCLSKPPPARERFKVGQWVEFMRCTDPQDPGSSQVWADCLYRSSWFSRAEQFSDEQMRALMANFNPKWIYWDGVEEFRHYNAFASAIEPTRAEDWDQMILTPELKEIVEGILREIDWWSISGLYNDEWLKELFEYAGCDECGLDADAHVVSPDPLGLRHAWCNVGSDPVLALKVARENLDLGPQEPGQLFYPEREIRELRFEAAMEGLRQQGLVDKDLPEWRKQWDRNEGKDINEQTRFRLAEALDNAQDILTRRQHP